ncbi:MAG: pseudouridine synthase [Tepidisphaeraceae bacterium]
MLRIDRILANRGYTQRSRVKEYLQSHDVRVANTRIVRPDTRVPEDDVLIDGTRIDPTTLYILLNKPVGLVCAHKEEDGNRIVYELFEARWRDRSPPITTVGRLDKDTSGLLIVTDDGDLVHRLTSPKFHVPRTYVAELQHPLRGDEAAIFASGTLMLNREDNGRPDGDKPLLPGELDVIDPTHARLTIREGRYHQVRRMFAAVGNHVVALHRERFGPLTLGDLQPGAQRMLTTEEVDALRTASRAGN